MEEGVSKRTIAILLVVLIAVSLAVIFTGINTKTTIIKGPVEGEVKLEIIDPANIAPAAPTESNAGGEVALDVTKKIYKEE